MRINSKKNVILSKHSLKGIADPLNQLLGSLKVTCKKGKSYLYSKYN